MNPQATTLDIEFSRLRVNRRQLDGSPQFGGLRPYRERVDERRTGQSVHIAAGAAILERALLRLKLSRDTIKPDLQIRAMRVTCPGLSAPAPEAISRGEHCRGSVSLSAAEIAGFAAQGKSLTEQAIIRSNQRRTISQLISGRQARWVAPIVLGGRSPATSPKQREAKKNLIEYYVFRQGSGSLRGENDSLSSSFLASEEELKELLDLLVAERRLIVEDEADGQRYYVSSWLRCLKYLFSKPL